MEEEKIPKISRRSFLKVSTGALAISGLSLPQAARVEGKEKVATLIDLTLCDGCADREMPACVAACKEINRNTIPAIADPIPVPWPRKISLSPL